MVVQLAAAWEAKTEVEGNQYIKRNCIKLCLKSDIIIFSASDSISFISTPSFRTWRMYDISELRHSPVRAL